MIEKTLIPEYLKNLQDTICKGMEEISGGRFKENLWERPGGGGGRTRILSGGEIEKGGVNFSEVYGQSPDFLIRQFKEKEDSLFYATGVSIVMHPKNPFVPIIHMNVRFISIGSHKWFGGGIDLTPHYVKREDAVYFHRKLKDVCDRHGKEYYEEYKANADEYFFIKHRNETRGIGGIFFDHLDSKDENEFIANWKMVQEVGECFYPLYKTLVETNRASGYTEKNVEWQRIRRGRYVEFNLVYDRGTKFGLETDGRTESILMSLPPLAAWEYDYRTEPGSPEAETLSFLKKGIDWLKA